MTPPAENAHALLEMFCEAGGTLIDTAAAYGAGRRRAASSAAWSRELGIRDEMVIATKAGFVIRNGKRIVDTSRRALLRDLDGSLRRLQSDYIDMWQIHAWGERAAGGVAGARSITPSSTGMSRAMPAYRTSSGWQTAQAATWQRAFPGRTPLISAQVEYSLLARRAEVEVLPAIRAFGMGFFPWSPLGRGVLTGQYRNGTPRGSRAATDHFSWFVEPYLGTAQPRRCRRRSSEQPRGWTSPRFRSPCSGYAMRPASLRRCSGARTAGQLAPGPGGRRSEVARRDRLSAR